MADLNELKPVGKLNPFAKFCCTIGNLPTSYMISLTYEEQLLWLCKYLEDTVIPAVNTNAEAVQELQELYVVLKNYVDNYFENLDVQDEINNKLDEMVEQGTLQEIVADYLNTKAIFGFDTINDMKQATNLINGSYAKTLGYYEINDGGSGLYKIVDDNTLVEDNGLIHNLSNGLKAVLIIHDKVYVEQFGMKKNNANFDNSSIFQNLILSANTIGFDIKFNNGIYYFSNPININERLTCVNITGSGQKYQSSYNGTCLNYTGEGWFITTQNLWRCNFSEFQIECTNNGNGIYINGISYQSHLKRIAIKNAIRGILVDGFAYGYFEELNIFAEENVQPEYGIYFNKNNTTEYLFIRDCTFGMNNTGDGIILEGGIHYQIKDCDMVACDHAILFQPVSGSAIRWLDISFIDISRCKYGLYFNPLGASISSGIISNIVINFSENANLTDEGITFLRPASFVTRDIKLKSIQLNALGTLPSYGITQAQNSVLNCELSVSYNTSNIPLKLKPTFYDEQILKEYYQPTKQVLTLNNNAGNSSYTYTMMTNSPFVEKPRVIVTDNKNMIVSCSVSNTHKGNLDITVQFDTNKTLTGEYIICFDIPCGETYVKTLNS